MRPSICAGLALVAFASGCGTIPGAGGAYGASGTRAGGDAARRGGTGVLVQTIKGRCAGVLVRGRYSRACVPASDSSEVVQVSVPADTATDSVNQTR